MSRQLRLACENLAPAIQEVPVPTFELIRSDERFHEIAGAWHALWLEREATVFQSHPWISECHRYLSGNNVRLHIGVLWDDTRLVAVVPCAVRRSMGLRVLEWAAQEFSDYCDGFGDLGALRACWTALHKLKHYDIIRLKYVRPDAAVVILLQKDWTEDREGMKCLQLKSLWSTGDAWLQAHYPKARNNYSRGLRKLQEMGRVEVEFHGTPPEGVIERLRTLKLEWAVANGVQFALVEEECLLSRLVNARASLDRLLLVVIKCDDEIVASSINATDGKRLLSYFTVYNPKHDRASPGILLLVECTRWAFDHGFTEHDHLRGAEPYKLPFSNACIMLRGYTGAATIRGHAALMLRRMANVLKRPLNPGLERPVDARRPVQPETVPADASD
jgi:CelD/BcsL family acetyltransferase involved in cellulose biosynthesis